MKEAKSQCNNYPELCDSVSTHVSWELRGNLSSLMTGLQITYGSDAKAQQEKASEFTE